MTTMKRPELLLPAGTLKNLNYAFAYGADAVYAGQPRYSLRVRNNDFQLENLAKGIEHAHSLNKKFFVASNLMPHNSKIKTYMKDMEPVIALKPDALIMADPGLIMMVRERWPEVPVHLSVQANTVNFAAVKFWKNLGLERIILSRELSLGEIEEIRQECPDIELEVFVHGALCIAYSGRCLLSGYFNHRDPNQGTCTNACRWEYDVTPADENIMGDIQQVKPQNIESHKIEFDAMAAIKNPPEAFSEAEPRHPLADNVYVMEEKNRPGEFMPILEDEHGTYVMNSKDLRAIQHIETLTKMGIDSFKIEGRTKSHYYVARTAQLYSQAIDDAVAGREFDATLYGKLENLSNRGYTEGFLERHPNQDYQNYLTGVSKSVQQQFVGEVTGYDDERQMVEVDIKNKLCVGDSIEVVSPQGNISMTIDKMEKLTGEPIDAALGSGYQIRFPLPKADYQRSLIAKNLPQ